LSANALAKLLHVPALLIHDIVLESRGVSADTALRFVQCFGGDAQSWLNLQAVYDLKIAQKSHAKLIARQVVPLELNAA